jgi:hypothetical protein
MEEILANHVHSPFFSLDHLQVLECGTEASATPRLTVGLVRLKSLLDGFVAAHSVMFCPAQSIQLTNSNTVDLTLELDICLIRLGDGRRVIDVGVDPPACLAQCWQVAALTLMDVITHAMLLCFFARLDDSCSNFRPQLSTNVVAKVRDHDGARCHHVAVEAEHALVVLHGRPAGVGV